ncbi:hypothetical protein [Phormidium nigroviride]
MNKYCKLIPLLLLATSITTTGANALAQTRRPSARAVQLLDFKGCMRSQGRGYWQRTPKEIPMSRQLYRAVGSFNVPNPGHKTEFICRLAEDIEPSSRFKRLSVSFGLSDETYWRGEYSIRLFSNGNSLDAINISSGISEPMPLVINIPSNTRFLAMEIECVRSTNGPHSPCDSLYVFDDTLE